MAELVNLTIDGKAVSVPGGTLVVDAARQVGVEVPVFCYHPKMAPVGMCRMCLVEIGRPMVDRETRQPVLEEDGSPKLQFGPNLETACTTLVSEGMVVLGATEKVQAGRKAILEFLLTSHPLDCPICDKGGECPLQNLTMGFGPGESRYLYADKMHQAKHVPLGDLIWLDRERCIQCGRCVRFQDEIVDDAVIGFFHRGRSLEIVTFSDPGFDSYFSGNTTDICPVGALTTTDFRFKARPWELRAAASICPHCPVGCNLTLNVRREAVSGGLWVVKRVMPRQHEGVNEVWICDKGRFGHHFAAQGSESQRLKHPLVRKGGELQEASWEEALTLVAERFRAAGEGLLTVAGGRLSNEDLFGLGELAAEVGGSTALYTHMGGGETTTQAGMAQGSNLGDLAHGSAVLVVGCDLEEEAPIWWLRVKQAAERGASVISLNPRETKLDRAAEHVLRYPFGAAAAAVLAMVVAAKKNPSGEHLRLPESARALARNEEVQTAARTFADAEKAIVFYGSEGMGLVESERLAEACAHLLSATGHLGRPNNGLIGVWPRANDQGAWELGWRPRADLREALEAAGAIYIAAADPVGDDPAYQAAFGGSFVVVQELFLTQTARLADVVLPAQAWTEREGSYTSGERRVQRFYPALQATTVVPQQVESPGTRRSPVLTAVRPMQQGPLADFAIAFSLVERLGGESGSRSAAAIFNRLSAKVPGFTGLTYQRLAEVKAQWPIISADGSSQRGDLYYGGTTYQNTQGLGAQLPLAGGGVKLADLQVADLKLPKLGLMAFPVTRLYDRGTTLLSSKLLHTHIDEPYVVLNAEDAGRLKVYEGSVVRLTFSSDSTSGGSAGQSVVVQAHLDAALPERVALVPRGFGVPIHGPTPVEVRPAK